MRIAYVAGFFKHVLPELQSRIKGHLDNGRVVWIPPYGHTDEPNINRFKGDFLGAVDRGVTEILICLFIMRGKTDLDEYVKAIIDLGKSRSQELAVTVEYFESARDAEGVIAKIEAFNPDTKPHPPANLLVLQQWIFERYRDKIILHPRAVNGAKRSQYEDVALIYSAIELLGVEYWDMRTSTPENADERRIRWEKRLQELELEFSPAISDSRGGEQGDEYRVIYPSGTAQKRVLENHLCKGSSREQRFCLRIYFFWDDAVKKVVIGWLPSHLDTRGT